MGGASGTNGVNAVLLVGLEEVKSEEGSVTIQLQHTMEGLAKEFQATRDPVLSHFVVRMFLL